MSCSIKGTSIYLTRGDSAYITVDITDASGNVYVPDENDEIKFTVKRSYKDADVLIEKFINHETMVLELRPEDTKPLQMNRDYYYDLQVTRNGGDVDTVITSSIFHVGEEIG